MSPALSSTHARWLRNTGLLIGLALLIWLPFEDTSTTWVVGFATLLCAWGTANLILRFEPRWRPGSISFLFGYALLGLLGGLSMSLVGLFLMAFKSGVHGHGQPDFVPGQVSFLLERTPLWGLAGLLIGGGCGLWQAK